MEGWIKIYRSSLDHWLYNEYRPLTKREAWENIILWANYEDDSVLIKGQLITCKRGQLLYSLETYAQKFVWSVSQVRSFFEILKKDGMIKVEGLKYTTRLTICNYDIYQDKQQTENRLKTDCQQPDNKLTADSSQQEKNDKKVKKEKNIISTDFILPDLAFKNIVDQWLTYRKNLKKPYRTQQGVEQFYIDLKSLSDNTPIIAQRIINQSIAKEWQGIFPLKPESTQQPKLQLAR